MKNRKSPQEVESRILRMLLSHDMAGVCDALLQRFGIVVSESDAATWCDIAVAKSMLKHCNCWTDGTAFMWLKNRVADRFKVGYSACEEIRFACEMHLFFTHLEETQEMLMRLRNEAASKPSVARSKISTSLLAAISPVDAVANRVCQAE